MGRKLVLSLLFFAFEVALYSQNCNIKLQNSSDAVPCYIFKAKLDTLIILKLYKAAKKLVYKADTANVGKEARLTLSSISNEIDIKEHQNNIKEEYAKRLLAGDSFNAYELIHKSLEIDICNDIKGLAILSSHLIKKKDFEALEILLDKLDGCDAEVRSPFEQMRNALKAELHSDASYNPNDASLLDRYIKTGDSLADLNKHTLALYYYQRAYELNPGDNSLFSTINKCKEKSENEIQATKNMIGLFKDAPETAPTLSLRGSSNNYGSTGSRNTNNSGSPNNGNRNTEENSDLAFKGKTARGYEFMQAEDYQTALTLFLAADKIKAYDVELCNNIAYCYFKLGDFGNALSFYNKALTINPNDPLTKVNLFNMYMWMGDNFLNGLQYQDALDNYFNAANLISDKAGPPLNNAAIIYERLNQTQDAKKYFVIAAKLGIEYAANWCRKRGINF